MHTLVENHFKAVKLLNHDKTCTTTTSHRCCIVPRVISNTLIKELSHDQEVLAPFESQRLDSPKLSFRTASILILKLMKRRKKVLLQADKQIIKRSIKYRKKMRDLEEKYLKLAPEIEGRSVKIENSDVI